jgi:hypothetical protein
VRNDRDKRENFSLLGGPLHRLGLRLDLVRDGTNGVALGLALGGAAWGVLAVLALAEGIGAQLFSLAVIGGHVRLLVVIPLFFVCESLFDPRMNVFVRTLVDSQVVPATELPALDAATTRIARWKDSWLPDAICLLAAFLMSALAPALPLPGSTAAYDASRAAGAATLTGLWYWIVCLTLFRFLMFRWLLRLILWWYFLRRVARLKLALVPTHPDGVGGLGYLEVVHSEFVVLILAISATAAAMFAEGMVAGTMSFAAIYPTLAVILAVDAALFLGPLCLFAPKLWLCRVTGLDTYMTFAARYVNDFDGKWVRTDAARGESPLGTPDLQSLADLSNSVNVVRNMSLVPASQRLLMIYAAAALLPMLPLLLLQYPVAELAEKLFKSVLSL